MHLGQKFRLVLKFIFIFSISTKSSHIGSFPKLIIFFLSLPEQITHLGLLHCLLPKMFFTLYNFMYT